MQAATHDPTALVAPSPEVDSVLAWMIGGLCLVCTACSDNPLPPTQSRSRQLDPPSADAGTTACPDCQDARTNEVDTSGPAYYGLCSENFMGALGRPLLPDGPNPDFASAYAAALEAAETGPFLMTVRGLGTQSEDDDVVTFAKAKGDGTTLETGTAYGYTLTDRRIVAAPKEGDVPFHLFFEGAREDIGVRGVAFSFDVSDDCRALQSAHVTLYLDNNTEANVKLGGSTLGSLLKAPTKNVGGLGFEGWEIALTGDMVALP